SAASLAGEADWRAEIAALAAEGARVAAGASLPAPDAARRLLRDHGLPAPDGIRVAGPAASKSVLRWCEAFAPSLLSRIEQHSGAGALFDLHDVDSAVDALAQPRVPLPGGASLIIERTQALTAIDVNSGSEANALAVNLAAAQEIARQLRLRHIGGIVVIDFISLPRAEDRSRTEVALAAALASDPARTQILPMSRLGLVELSRERRGPELELES
ncbi:MAG TPA: ribonuclease E/G, partial [Alphaproteobacteria bacterium]|nr:ribonuclease E/G [Alphaproteobacteria bacterium]